ncbi:DUF4265 domain-containing protein [Flavobacterium tructae]|uniref:DUF4265 domain-containing protein n=1 Tax=Flavobacterium tructae TaxID=1114873 RepID=A0A1S1J721_9FLAO|nr:DUF4265 domain-containing protein [Flavobacterium tructae]OHT44103.1 hypothetical protein BHE19_14320 [Flavobacterium tructae]OXB20257.1 hypothetical protein B0A71_07675 [Flavobacterium tructae]OXB22966.1 hypothetical protein B0A80_13315 [Flavobacterium tructae]
MAETHKKILFKYYSTYLEEIVSETMWAEILDSEKGLFKLDNIPFFGPLIATDDIFRAEYDENEKCFIHKETIEHSGNSIVQVLILEKEFDKEIIREKLKAINCLSEALNDTFLAVEIAKNTDYSIVKNLLSEYEANAIIEFAEPCLSDKHRTDLLKN